MASDAIESQAAGYLRDLGRIMEDLDLEIFRKIVNLFLEAYHRETRIFTMGNGGSGATASHLVCDINKGCCLDLDKKFKALCLNDNLPTMMAVANDIDYREIFRIPLQNFCVPGDLVLGISGSGNSENVLRAVAWAREKGAVTIGLSGFGGGHLAKMVDVALVVPSDDMQKVEDVHLVVCHMLMQALFRHLHPDKTANPCA